MYSLDSEASADNLLGSSHGRLSCATADPSSVVEVGIPYATYPFSFSSLQPFRLQPFLAVNAQTGRLVVGQATVLKAPILPSVLVAPPVFERTANLALETELLGGRVRHHRFFSSRPDVLKGCLDQETQNQSIGSMVENLSKGGFTGTLE